MSTWKWKTSYRRLRYSGRLFLSSADALDFRLRICSDGQKQYKSFNRCCARNIAEALREGESAEPIGQGHRRSSLVKTRAPSLILIRSRLRVQRGDGAEVWNVDNHHYFDGEFSGGLYGHSDPIIKGRHSGRLGHSRGLGCSN